MEEIARLAPTANDYPLVTRLRDGRSVVVGKEKLLPLLDGALRFLDRACDVILLLCSGPFPDMPSRVPLLYPSRLLEHFVRGLSPASGTVVVPHEGQVGPALRRWGALVPKVTARVSTPYPWECPADLSADLVIMDCLGYSLAMKEDVRRRSGGHAVLVRSVAAAALRKLLN